MLSAPQMWYMDQKRSHELRQVEAAAPGLNRALETDTGDVYEPSWLQELLACDNIVPVQPESSYGEDFNEISADDQRLPVCHSVMNKPSAVLEPSLCPTNVWTNDRSWCLASARQRSCALRKPPLLKSSLLDDAETLTVDSYTPWMPPVITVAPARSPTFPSHLSSIYERQCENSIASEDFAVLSNSYRKRKGGPNGRSDEELRQLDPIQVKRILSNRASAARSKDRRKRYIEDLKEQSHTLAEQNAHLEAQIRQLEWILQEEEREIQHLHLTTQAAQNDLARMIASNGKAERPCPVGMHVTSISEDVVSFSPTDFAQPCMESLSRSIL